MSRVMRKKDSRVWRKMKSADNRGIFPNGLKVLHIHVLLAAPLGACDMAQASADEHESRIAIRETTHHPSTAADFPVEPFHDIVRADTSPVFAGEIAVSQGFLNTILHFPGGLFQFHGTKFLHNGFYAALRPFEKPSR